MGNHYKRILFVEDNNNDIETTLVVFKKHNLANEVVVVKDGDDTLNYLYQQGKFAMRLPGNPIFIILNVKLIKTDGMELLKTIKQDPGLKTIPVVILSSSREEDDVNLCYQLGANAYVVKPVNFHEFCFKIKELGLFWAVVNESHPRSG